MITGTVNALLQPFIGIELRHRIDGFKRVEVKLDTGFNGEIGLPTSLLDQLESTFVDQKEVVFGNGRRETVDVYDVEALISDQVAKLVALDLGEGSHLLGMKALPMWTACVEFKANGDVTIQKPQ